MDRTQFIIAIVTNIVAAIIIWLAKRLTRWVRNKFRAGTVQEKVRRMLSQSVIHILVDSFSILFNLGLLIRTLIRQSSFTRLEVFTPMMISAVVVFWVHRLVSDIRKERYSRRIADLDKGYEYLQKIISELRQDADDIRGVMKGLAKREKRQPRSSLPEEDSQKNLFP